MRNYLLGERPINTIEFVLEHNDILNLVTTPVLIPFPRNRAFIPALVGMYMIGDCRAGAYTNIGTDGSFFVTIGAADPTVQDNPRATVNITSTASSAFSVDTLLSSSNLEVTYQASGFPIGPVVLSSHLTGAWYIGASNETSNVSQGNYTGGNPNNTVKVVLMYIQVKQ